MQNAFSGEYKTLADFTNPLRLWTPAPPKAPARLPAAAGSSSPSSRKESANEGPGTGLALALGAGLLGAIGLFAAFAASSKAPDRDEDKD